MPSMQTRRKRKIGQYLARLRVRSEHTTEQVGALLHRTASQISKIENGYHLCVFAELTTLLVLYSATEEERAEAQSLWEDAKQDGTRIAHSSAVPPKFRAFLRTEADAASVHEVQPSVIPGLLQTAEYAAAVRLAAHRLVDPSLNEAKAVAARLARQNLLHADRPLRLHALVDEAAIRRVIGNRNIMVDQLHYLLDMGEKANVTVQVIPEALGAYGTMSGPVTIFGFDDPQEPDSVYLEYPCGGEWVDDPADVGKFIAMFGDVSGQALPAAESAALVRERMEVVEGL